ncbi:NAD(P)/FAD-dependent oxidoreductase [Bosea beijingensis]|uniref:NAD(P)/FAD-dependent oxidoreductase n=1 Tax=Bosea beijingensis TaxID=3068632 RepID=UPI0027407FEF|nr:FAD-dependent oxidoreductase [Bosea sp. REN20]
MSKLTYPKYTNLCGWTAMLPVRTPRAALSEDVTVDYAVVGAGYTGVAAARRLHELDPQARIALVEATTVGEGSSARNSGFTTPDVLPRTASMEMAEKARNQTRLFTEAFDWLQGIIRDNDIACDMQKVGSIRAAATEEGEATLRKVAEVARANNLQHTILDRAGIRERIGADYYRYGLHMHDTWLLQPAALIRGLVDALPANITLYEQSPVRDISREGSDWRLRIEGGSIRCRTVVLANNGFIPRLGYLKSRMATIFTYAAVTEAVKGADIEHLGQSPAWGLLPSHRLGTTLRRIGRDRLMVRSLYAHDAEIVQSTAIRELRDRFQRRWPALRHVEFEYVWGGTTAFTMNGAPWWGKLEDGLYASGGCNGSGLAKGTMLGRRLAELIRGVGDAREVEAIMGEASWIAPEPFRSIGFRVISALESRKAGLEA